MRTPHLATAMIAAASMIGMGGNASEVSWQKQATADTGPLDKPFAKQKGRWGLNQRQVRKGRRRAHAAGVRNAFSR